MLGALDVKDAFLQAPQEEPTQVTTAGGHFLVKRHLPGQRIGAEAWFEYLTAWLRGKDFIFWQINPRFGRFGDEALLLFTYELLDSGLKIMPGKYAETRIESCEATLGKAKIQKLPCTQEMLEPDLTTLLDPQLAILFRSVVAFTGTSRCGLRDQRVGRVYVKPYNRQSSQAQQVDWLFERHFGPVHHTRNA